MAEQTVVVPVNNERRAPESSIQTIFAFRLKAARATLVENGDIPTPACMLGERQTFMALDGCRCLMDVGI
jgi:hypothetical protein